MTSNPSKRAMDIAYKIFHALGDQSSEKTFTMQAAPVIQSALDAETAELRAEMASDEEMLDALDAKVRALSPHATCGCSFDKPGDTCMHHSPQLVATLAEIDRLRGVLEEIVRYTPYHGGECPVLATARKALNGD